MKSFLLITTLLFGATLNAFAGQTWRAATEKELAALIPARAPVEKEQIETELRTASGVTNGKGKFIAGVVIITAGYAADGKYSHFFITQAPIKIGEMALRSGEYVFGYRRADNDTLEVKFYEAATGKQLGAVSARRDQSRSAIRSLLISPPNGGNGKIQLGRFAFEFVISE
ncbi:MAG TPA: hypothetical protein VEF04_20310 [Blastocatellia bacterium]|nr:hypothetical protein [Blastocatellia bacterium]